MKKTCDIVKRVLNKYCKLKSAYTLAEVVVVMLVVAVVVSVSIKITKVKLDNIISYTYYMGYSTLRNVTGQMLGDFKSTDDDYMQTVFYKNFNLFNRLYSTPVFAKTVYRTQAPLVMEHNGGYVETFLSHISYDFDSLDDMYRDCSSQENGCLGVQGDLNIGKTLYFSDGTTDNYKKCPGKYNYYRTFITRPTYKGECYNDDLVLLYQNLTTYDERECNHPCTNDISQEPNTAQNCGRIFAGDKNTGYYFILPYQYNNAYDISAGISFWDPPLENYNCSKFAGKFISGTKIHSCSGQYEDDNLFLCKPKSGNIYPPYIITEEDDTPTENVCSNQPSEAEQQVHRCQNQEEWKGEPTCGYVPITCPEGNHWSVNSCGCVPESPTLPRKGINFCRKFVSYTNTKSNSPECTGTAISSTETDFSDKTADITLRNGMRIYNMSQNPQEIGILEGNTQGASYDGVPNINTFGYTVYLDIDGEKGSSTLWEDVYKFYITMAGKVIPAYDENNPNEEVGGNSRRHLMTSVERETIVDGRRQMRWLKKSVSFKEGACTSNYLGASSRYCNGVNLLPDCNDPINPCLMKHVSPVKFF